jgi:hypothetical protein
MAASTLIGCSKKLALFEQHVSRIPCPPLRESFGHLGPVNSDDFGGSIVRTQPFALFLLLAGACSNASPGSIIDAAVRTEGGAPPSIFGASYGGPGSLVIEAARVRSQGGHVVVASFVLIEGPPRPETIWYGSEANSYRGERLRDFARYVVLDPLGEPLHGEFRVDGVLVAERIFAPDGTMFRDENDVGFVRDHLRHPTNGTHVLFLIPSRTSGVWLAEWRTSIDGSTVSGDGTRLGASAALGSLRR